MGKWSRRMLGILAVSGGGIGAIAAFTVIASSNNIFDWLFCVLFIVLYGWGIACGIRLIEGHANALKSNFIFWLCQVPAFASPIAGYFLGSGLYVTAWIRPGTMERGFDFAVGSAFRYSLLEQYQPLTLGVNLVAVAICIWFYVKMPKTVKKLDTVRADIDSQQ